MALIETPDDARYRSRILALVSLMLAGEAIFGLPFHVSRYFRPAFVEVFGVTQTQLGWMGSLYGGVATISYLLGGRLADRFSARGLLSFGLVITGLSGLYMLTIPSPTALFGLYAFWGVSTILPFWSALIRATRDWGGAQQQGRAFGMLDAGRGLLAAVLATIALLLFAWVLPSFDAEISIVEKTKAIQITIVTYIVACLFAAIMVFICLPKASRRSTNELPFGSNDSVSPWLSVIRMPAVWFQAIVIVGAYCTFKGIDYYSQYAKDIWGWSDVEASTLSTLSSWIRPIATVVAGLIADRFRPSRTVIAAFVVVALACISMALMNPSSSGRADGISGGSPLWLLWGTIMVGCLGIFALRGIYFALLEESQVPLRVTGTAVGVVSFIGYTPEIFMPVLGGMLIDHWNGGITGYQVFFGLLVLACLVGIFAAWRLRRLVSIQQTGSAAR
ncbi:MAG: MFS transporter [Planctomycetales bacterium]